MTLVKLVSGGQTGVDRAALDAALAVGFPCGCWAPGDRMAEDGVIAERYPLTPLPKGGYRQRTRQNVVDSDGTTIIYFNSLKGGTRLTRDLCALEKRPYVLIDAERLSVEDAVEAVRDFIDEHRIAVLNVAGPRASGWTSGYSFSLDVIRRVLSRTSEGIAAGSGGGRG